MKWVKNFQTAIFENICFKIHEYIKRYIVLNAKQVSRKSKKISFVSKIQIKTLSGAENQTVG